MPSTTGPVFAAFILAAQEDEAWVGGVCGFHTDAEFSISRLIMVGFPVSKPTKTDLHQ